MQKFVFRQIFKFIYIHVHFVSINNSKVWKLLFLIYKTSFDYSLAKKNVYFHFKIKI